MREILFRGKCTDTGKWYEGQYIHLHKTTYCFKADYDNDKDNDIHQIVFEKMTDWGLPNHHLRADVIPESIGQFTGLTDKNGKKIFEGDICSFVDFHSGSDMGTYCEGVWEYEDCYFYITNRLSCETTDLICEGKFDGYVIGNIHDNPELLKGGAE